MKSTEVAFQSGPLTLAGTLALPNHEGVGPAVLLISGSGPIDRNSNTSKLSIDVMGQVAQHFQDHGVASLRFDKRGIGSSEGNYLAAGLHDNVDDAAAALETLRARPEVDPTQIFVLGHSEGALIAAHLAANDPQLAGVVVLAGTASRGEDVLRWQATRIGATLPKPVKWLLRLLRQDIARTQSKRLAQLKATTTPTTRIQFVKINAKWFREFMAYDPAPSLQAITAPVLAMTGSKDLQVDPNDIERICQLVPTDCSGRVIEDLTHLLRTEIGPPTVRTYKKQAKRPIDAGLLTAVTAWINENTIHPTPARTQP